MTKKQLQRILRIVLVIGTITSLFFVPWIVLWVWIQPLPDTVQEQADKAISYNFDGIVLYIDQSGKPPSYVTAGWHDKKKEKPAKPDALFKIASISKLYNAVAITKLAHNKQLSLDNTLADFFPELVGRIENAEKITVRMMIQHTSGIPNYTDTFNYWAHPKESNKENLALVLDLPAKFEPGEDYEYSNTNYLLLSQIMDKVLGYNHFQYIQEEILNRLHLKNTFSSVTKVDSNKIMSGYHVGHPLDLKTDNTGMVASAEDVGKFIRALNDGSLFDEGEQDIYASLYRYGHTGLVPGYQSIARYHRDIDAVVVQFTGPTNFEGYNWNLSEIMYNRMIKILTNQE
ncbi:beta-lactamase family protein [Flavobacteriaceae bacterium TK19130]|nr:beta-lactamase family protein [Thermobacterium salinum]